MNSSQWSASEALSHGVWVRLAPPGPPLSSLTALSPAALTPWDTACPTAAPSPASEPSFSCHHVQPWLRRTTGRENWFHVMWWRGQRKDWYLIFGDVLLTCLLAFCSCEVAGFLLTGMFFFSFGFRILVNRFLSKLCFSGIPGGLVGVFAVSCCVAFSHLTVQGGPILPGKLLKRFLPVSLIGGNKAAETENRAGFGFSIVFLSTSITFFYWVSFADFPCFRHFIYLILTTVFLLWLYTYITDCLVMSGVFNTLI